MEYNVREILEYYHVYPFSPQIDGDNLTVLCPFHEDTNPSGRLSLSTGRYVCYACPERKYTNVFAYLAAKLNKTIIEVYREVGRTFSESRFLHENIQEVHDLCTNLNAVKYPNFISSLEYRCITASIRQKYDIGVKEYGNTIDSAISIPIFDNDGQVLFVKLYRPGNKKRKYSWLTSAAQKQTTVIDRDTNLKINLCEAWLYPIDQLLYDTILICGGELKALAAAEVLNKYDIGAISPTGSESLNWQIIQLVRFSGKTVYVCYDIDAVGEKGAENACTLLRNYASKVHKVKLPLDITKYPTGDINDFIREGGDLHSLIENTPEWESKDEIEEKISNTAPIKLSLDEAVSSTLVGNRIEIHAVASSMDTAPYKIPKKIHVTCNRGKHGYCASCTLFHRFKTDSVELSIRPERIEIVEMIGEKLEKQIAILKKVFGIWPKCTSVNFENLEMFNIEDVKISQPLDITSRESKKSMQSAYCIGTSGITLNEEYKMVGRLHPHPKNQQATLLISEYELTQDALSTYSLSLEDIQSLKIFQPAKNDNVGYIQLKMEEICKDLEANVTRIFKRELFHVAIDLVYHSPLFINFDGNEKLKGWVEALVVGDSAQGKSKAIDAILNHYGLGEKVVCKGATVPGLMGGLQKYGDRWFATWGKIPANDKRLVILEELKGTNVEVISKLTDMRSSGMAELNKIEKPRTYARTRLLAASNARGDQNISSYNYGIESVKELIGNPEDIRRFDFAMVMERSEVDVDKLHSYRPVVEHKYTGDLCRKLILFAWTVPNVVFEDEKFILDTASELCKRYTDDIPLVDRGSMHEKIARLSAAVAARLFSIDDDKPDTLIVHRVHTEYVAWYLKQVYDKVSFGYLEFSKVVFRSQTITDELAVKKRILNNTTYPKELVEALLSTFEIDTNFIQDVLGWPTQEARDLLSFLFRSRCLRKVGRTYYKQTKFTQLLKEMEEGFKQGNVRAGKPVYLKDEKDDF